MTNEWTTEYPKEPGYYWIRNYTIQRYNRQEYVSGSSIVDVDSELRGSLPGEDPLYFRKDLISAEWFGPIQPPQQPEPTVCARCGRYNCETEQDGAAK